MHSLLIVIGNGDLETYMDPYYEGLEVDEYCNGEVSSIDKKRMLDFYNGKTIHHYKSFEECYASKGRDWNDNRWRKDDDGVWREYSTYNPDSKWDWYEVGGRWAGTLELKEGVAPIQPINFSWGWKAEDKQKVLTATPKRADKAYLKDIANVEELQASGILQDGEWIDTIEEDGWHFKNIGEYLKDLPGDTLVTCVDYHI